MIPSNITVDSRYSAQNVPAPPWEDLAADLVAAEIYALTTVLPDSTPHTVPVAGMWTDDGFVFCTGGYEQKARNIAGNKRASVHIGSTSFSSGMDIVVRGEIIHHTDTESLTRLAEGFEGKYPEFFRFEVTDGALLNAHGNRADVYRLEPEVVHAFTRGENTVQARYAFGEKSS